LLGRTAQLAKGVQQCCGDALRIVFRMRLARFWPWMKKPVFSPLRPGLLLLLEIQRSGP